MGYTTVRNTTSHTDEVQRLDKEEMFLHLDTYHLKNSVDCFCIIAYSSVNLVTFFQTFLNNPAYRQTNRETERVRDECITALAEIQRSTKDDGTTTEYGAHRRYVSCASKDERQWT